MLLGSIPIVAWLAGSLLLHARAAGALRSLRGSLLAGAVLAGAWLVLGTELLSLFAALRFWPVLLWWALPALALVAILALRHREELGAPLREWLRRQRPALPEAALAAPVLALLGWSWCQAFFSPPNNIDSLSYHLPRQVHWMQQASVASYATSSLRQIAMPPLTEFAGLHLMLLTGSDRLHNLVQWTALVLTLGSVSLLTRRLGGSGGAQLLAALWVVTVPMAFLQASNTKNDVVTALWTCTLLLWVAELAAGAELDLRRGLLLGLAFGVLVLTKGTGPLFAVPIAGLLLHALRGRLRSSTPALALAALVALGSNAGAFARNVQAFGSPVPRDPAIHGGDRVVNEELSARAVVSNLVRNLAPHLATPSEALNERLTSLVLRLHERLGLEVDDPRTTFRESGFRPYAFLQEHEDLAAAPVHLLLLLLLPALLVARRHDPERAAAWRLLLALAAAYLLFCAALKFQVWNVRLTLALAAWPAPVFARLISRGALARAAPIAALALLCGLLPSLNPAQRPLLGPYSVLTSQRDAVRYYPETDRGLGIRERQLQRMSQLQPRVVGIASGWSFADYQLQRALLDGMRKPPTFTAFNAALQIPGRTEPDPDVLLVAPPAPDRIVHASTGTVYVRRERLRPYELFLREAPTVPAR